MSINFSAFEIGRRALNAASYGVSVAGQNISNVNTPGYSRQSVQLAESAPANITGITVGSGVTVQGVQAFRDRFIESRIQTETGVSGRLSAQRDALAPVETVLQGTDNGGLQNALNSFFGAFRDLDANPNSTSLRAIVAQRGANLASSFSSTRSKLTDIQLGADEQIRDTVNQVNGLSTRIADLNARIQGADATGGSDSALRDQRGQLINQISELTGARSTENSDGTVTLTIGEGRALVNGVNASTLRAGSTPPLGLSAITLDDQPATFDEGRLRGLQNAIAETGNQINGLDELAGSVVDRVNTVHSSGADQDGNPGVNFFAVPAGGQPVTAANISLNPAISANPRRVVASALNQPGQSGTVAGQIANLLADPNSTVGARTGSFSSIYGSFISEAGEQIRTADNNLETQTAIIAQATAQRNAVSGVSLDEEAINLLQYQKAYDAAARFIKIADEMTQTILSLAQ